MALALVVFALDRLPPDTVALCLLAVLAIARWVTPAEAFSGFATGTVVVLTSSFVISLALEKSGLSERVGRWLLTATTRRRGWLPGALMAVSAAAALVMSNVAAMAILPPTATDALRRRRQSVSRTLLPMAFAAQLGGMATLLTTSNLVVGEFLRQNGGRGFGLLDFLPVGGPLAVAGLVYLWIVSPRVLPEHSATEARLAGARGESPAQVYQLARRLESMRILENSPLVGQSLGKSGLARLLSAVVLAVVHPDGSQRRAPEPTLKLAAGDILVLDGVPPDRSILGEIGLQSIRIKKPSRYLSSPRVALLEGVVAPRSGLAGRTLRDLDFRERTGGISVLAIWRGGEFLETDISHASLAFGDALLMQGPRSAFARMRDEREILLLGSPDLREPPSVSRAARIGIIVAATLAAAAIFPAALPVAFFVGATALLASGALASQEAYRNIEWRSVVLVAAMLPVGLALTRTGAARMLAEAFLGHAHARSAPAFLAVFVILTALLTQVLPGGAATPLIVAPIAISAAIHIGANPRPFALAVALATSTSFVTPFAHPVNVLVMGPGAYRFRDYLRLGLPLALLLIAGIILLVPLQISLTP
jgi:di/tricarboxylate transporter